MKTRLATVALLVAAAAASAAVNAYRTGISLPQAVKLGDGSVLPAGPYDVQIHYKGFGNAAELWFFRGGVLKGKSPAEVRGFPSTEPAGAASEASPKLQKASSEGKVFPKVESSSPGGAGDLAADHKDWSQSAGAHGDFAYEKAGFRAGQKGTVMQASPGMLKLSFDSANSAAGFSAILPYVEKGRK
jgi:hypothetical protein